ncbi:putative laccase-1, partial [Quercus suber]
SIEYTAAWYKGNLKKEVDEALEDGSDLPHSDAYTINVDYNKTYLLRIINAVMNAEFFFAVAQHNLTVVGMDGRYVKPLATSYIMISPGQTMDVLITTNQSLGRYYMAARQYSSEDASVTAFDHVNATAILQYESNYSFPSSPSFPIHFLFTWIILLP